MLTARDAPPDRIEGLDAGADDYLVKPFDFGELLARVRALQRRPHGVDGPILNRGRLELDPRTRMVTAVGAELRLTATEYHILELLLRRAPAVVDRKAIAEHAWDDETDPLGSNAIDVQLEPAARQADRRGRADRDRARRRLPPRGSVRAAVRRPVPRACAAPRSVSRCWRRPSSPSCTSPSGPRSSSWSPTT